MRMAPLGATATPGIKVESMVDEAGPSALYMPELHWVSLMSILLKTTSTDLRDLGTSSGALTKTLSTSVLGLKCLWT